MAGLGWQIGRVDRTMAVSGLVIPTNMTLLLLIW